MELLGYGEDSLTLWVRRAALENNGFQGFVTIRELRNGRIDGVPKVAGVYAVLRELDTPPMFLDENPWINGAHVIYIGKGNQLQRRIQQYLDFGAGMPIGHWGGRLIWQIENSDDFIITWKLVEVGETARILELKLLNEFEKIYRRLPFANLRK